MCQTTHTHTQIGRKAAMKFDVEKMFEETRRTAKEYSQQISGAYLDDSYVTYN